MAFVCALPLAGTFVLAAIRWTGVALLKRRQHRSNEWLCIGLKSADTPPAPYVLLDRREQETSMERLVLVNFPRLPSISLADGAISDVIH